MTHARRVLVLGGISSGKSSFAERLLTEELTDPTATFRYLATGRENPDDADWQARITAHRARRDERWQTVECGADPDLLISALAEVPADAAVLVDDLGGWVGTLLDQADAPDADAGDAGSRRGTDRDAGEPADSAARLAAAVRDCPAHRLVLVSPEVGLSVVPATRAGRLFADLLGTCNRAVADVCDQVALVVAGRAVWLPATETGPLPAPVAPAPVAEPSIGPGTTPAPDTSGTPAAAVPATADQPVDVGPADQPVDVGPADQPVDVGPADIDDEIVAIGPPDRIAINATRDRLRALATGGAGLGVLAEPIAWAVGGAAGSGPWTAVRVVLVGADHDGGAAAGGTPAATTRSAVDSGSAPLARLVDRAGAGLVVADLPGAGFTAPVPAMETTDVLSAEQVDRAFALGRELADRAVDEGVQVLVPAACGAGVEAAAATVLAAATGSEPAGLLGRVVATAGSLDDQAWIARCVAARDALHRVRLRARDARSLLAMLGGPDLAALTGLLIGAAIRHTPVLVDNPATATAMILARDLAPSSPWWCLVPDHGRHPAVRLVCDLLGMETFLDLGLGLGDGCTALTALGVLQPGLALAATLPDEDSDGTSDPVPTGAGAR